MTQHHRAWLGASALRFVYALVGAGVVLLSLAAAYLIGTWPFAPASSPRSAEPTRADAGAVAGEDREHGEHGEHGDAERQPTAGLEREPVTVRADALAAFGVRVEPVRHESLARELRAPAVVAPDEARVSQVHTRVSGWLERLHVDQTGQTVRARQPLAEIFSEQLLAAQREYVALLAASALPSSLLEGARARMKVLGMTDAQIAELGRRREARRLVTVYAPRSGSVLRLNVRAGAAVDPSVELMAVADLSHVWVIAELPEHDAAHVSVGTPARLAFAGLPEGSTESNVTFVYPTLTPGSRTVRVRFDVANPGPLRPGSYGTAIVQAPKRHVLTVPRDAVVDTGIEQHVFVVGEGGALVPRTVRTGARFEERVEIRSGIESGERVVVSGVFLIDSESRLRASGGTGHAHGADDAEQEAPRDPHAGH